MFDAHVGAGEPRRGTPEAICRVEPHGPLRDGIRQHRPSSFQMPNLRQGRPAEPSPRQHLSNPLHERPPQIVIPRPAHPSGQCRQHVRQVRRRTAVLEPRQGRHQVAARQIVLPPIVSRQAGSTRCVGSRFVRRNPARAAPFACRNGRRLAGRFDASRLAARIGWPSIMERPRCRSPSGPTARFTERQGQYPASIHACTKVHGRPPAQADMQRYFAVTAPSVHRMVLGLERRGPLRRAPGRARNLEVLVAPETLPVLR